MRAIVLRTQHGCAERLEFSAEETVRTLVTATILMAFAGPGVTGDRTAAVHHELGVEITPSEHGLAVTDSLRLSGAVAPDDGGGYRFVLHAGLAPEVTTEGWRLEGVADPSSAGFFGLNATTDTVGADVPLEGWRLVPEGNASEPVVLSYGGTLHYELATSGEEYQRSFSETPGIIDERGVFLAGTSFWVPTFGDGLMTFQLEVVGLQPPWDVVSQGRRVRHEILEDGSRATTWRLDHPTEEVYLVAGPWHRFEDVSGKVDIFAFLREDDPALASKYLEATKRYLRL